MGYARRVGWVLFVAIAVGAVAVASGLAQQVEPVKIGVIQPLLGPVAGFWAGRFSFNPSYARTMTPAGTTATSRPSPGAPSGVDQPGG